MNRTDCQYRFKLIMIGGDCVGKSCMLQRYTRGQFPESVNVTIGMSFRNHILEMEPGVRVALDIYDTAGHESFWQVICCCFPQSAGCLLVFDLGDNKSFDYIKHRYTEVCKAVRPYSVRFLLVGHKCDREEREVSQEEVDEFASKVKAPYIEASAKTGHNVAEAFELLTRHIYQGLINGEVHLHESWGKIENKTNKCCAS